MNQIAAKANATDHIDKIMFQYEANRLRKAVQCILIFITAYGMGIGIYLSTKRNYRHREEHGSARWGGATAVNKKYRDKDLHKNKILTQNTRIGLDGRKHRRNLNVMVVGGSGSSKTRFYAKPNVMQATPLSSFLTPKGKF